MVTQTARFWGVLACIGAVAMVLAACSSSPKEPDPNIYPKEYKAQILLELQRLLDDPTNVRDAYISEPALVTVNKEQRYRVCVRSNSRNLVKEYEGSKDRIAYFYAGFLNQLVEATPEQCGSAAYQPWPELQTLCFGKSCK